MKRWLVPAVLIVVLVPVAVLAGIWLAGDRGTSTPESTVPAVLPTRARSFALPVSPVLFGSYTPVPLLGPAAAPYAGPATPHSLRGVRIAPDVRTALKEPGVAGALARAGFVVVPSDLSVFQFAYEGNVYSGWPVFVTTDVAYHEWHLLFDKTLRDLEQQVLLPKLVELVDGSLQAAHAQRAELDGTAAGDAASRVEQLFEVAAAELGRPVELEPLAKKEVALIDAHGGTTESPLLETPVDYSLFTPRGHYTRTRALTRFFLGMSVLGQLPSCLPGTFRCPGIEPARIGILASRLLAGHADLAALWRSIYEPTAFLVGRADDYTPLEVASAARKVDPGWLRDARPFADDATVAKVVAGLVAARPVLIDPEKAAIRFLGTRFVIDSYLLDQLLYPNVGTETKPRYVPSGLDVAAAFGSDFAYRTLERTGATRYAHYDSQLAKVRKAVAERPAAAWGSTVYDAWLAALQPLFAPHGQAFPDFMRTALWTAKDHQSALGSYTELRHDTVLFAKQAAAEGAAPAVPVPRNWVEPDPVAFGRLGAAATLLREGLRERGLLTPRTAALLRDEIGMFGFLQRIARDELAARPIAKQDNDRLTHFGSELESLWWRTSDSSQPGNVTMPDQSDAVVADIASSPRGVLELGTGRIDRIYVLVPDDSGAFEVAVGGVYSYYEFTTPPGQRLDDTGWRDLLERNQQPSRPAWEKAFIAGTRDLMPPRGP